VSSFVGILTKRKPGYQSLSIPANPPISIRCFLLVSWSGREDLNLRPLAPQASALTSLRHVPTSERLCTINPLECQAAFMSCRRPSKSEIRWPKSSLRRGGWGAGFESSRGPEAQERSGIFSMKKAETRIGVMSSDMSVIQTCLSLQSLKPGHNQPRVVPIAIVAARVGMFAPAFLHHSSILVQAVKAGINPVTAPMVGFANEGEELISSSGARFNKIARV
jgi:hypothetical protein